MPPATGGARARRPRRGVGRLAWGSRGRDQRRVGLAAAVVQRGGQGRRRAIDLAISATASSAVVPLVTHNDAGFKLIDDLVDVPITRTSTGRSVRSEPQHARVHRRTGPDRAATPN